MENQCTPLSITDLNIAIGCFWGDVFGTAFFISVVVIILAAATFMAGVGRLSLPPLFTSVIIVTVGTTLAESVLVFLSSLNQIEKPIDAQKAVLHYQANYLAYGIILGSTAFNLLLVLPFSRMVRAITGNVFVVRTQVVIRDLSLLIIAVMSIGAIAFVFNNTGIPELLKNNNPDEMNFVPLSAGFYLMIFAAVYLLIFLATEAANITKSGEDAPSQDSSGTGWLLILVGFALVVAAAYILVQREIFEAIEAIPLKYVKIDDADFYLLRSEIFKLGFLIGAILCIPELSSSVFYARQKWQQEGESLLTTGNVLTSSIMNLTLVAGIGIVVAHLSPTRVDGAVQQGVMLDFYFLLPHLVFILIGALMLAFFFGTKEHELPEGEKGGTFSLFEGALLMILLGLYVAYLMDAFSFISSA